MGDKHSAPGAVFTVPNSLTRFGINVLYSDIGDTSIGTLETLPPAFQK